MDLQFCMRHLQDNIKWAQECPNQPSISYSFNCVICNVSEIDSHQRKIVLKPAKIG